MIDQFEKLGVPLRENLYIIFFGILLIVGGGITNIVLIRMIGNALQSDSGPFSLNPTLFISALCLAFFLSVFAQFILEGLGHQLVYQIRENLLRRIVQADPEYFHRLEKSKVYNIFSQDIPAILFAIQITPYTLYGLSLIVTGLCYMLWLSWTLALAVIGVLLIVMFTCNAILSFAVKRHQRDRAIQNKLVTAYSQIIYSHKELSLNEVRGNDIIEKITAGDALESKHLQISAGRLISVSSQLMGILPIALVGIVLWGASLQSDDYVEIGISFAVVLMFIRQPIGNLIHQIEEILRARIAFQHIAALDLPAPHYASPAVELSRTWNTISTENVVYTYAGNDKFSLGPINLQINRGEITFLVGSNGAGKSTLLQILCGLITPIEGRVLVDNEEVSDSNRRQYRAMFSAVLSDFFLFDTISKSKNNTDNKNTAQFIDLLELAEVLSFNDEKINTDSLSTGQKKRLAMVIACMDNRSVMVLDEWAADQDPRFRKVFYEHILPKLRSEGITLIVISHDDRYFNTADKIVSIESGALCG